MYNKEITDIQPKLIYVCIVVEMQIALTTSQLQIQLDPFASVLKISYITDKLHNSPPSPIKDNEC